MIVTFGLYDGRVYGLKVHGNVVRSIEMIRLEKDSESGVSIKLRPELGEALAVLDEHGFEQLHDPLLRVSGPVEGSEVVRPEYLCVWINRRKPTS